MTRYKLISLGGCGKKNAVVTRKSYLEFKIDHHVDISGHTRTLLPSHISVSNNIGPEGARALAESLKSNKSVKTLE